MSTPQAQHPGDIDLEKDIDQQIKGFRQQLLSLRPNNPLLDCPHGQSASTQIRIVDELPDAVFEVLENGGNFALYPLPAPRDKPDDEDGPDFSAALDEYKESSLTYQTARRHVQAGAGGPNGLAKLDREARDHVRLVLHMDPWEPESTMSAEERARRHDIISDYELPPSNQSELPGRYSDDGGLQTLLEAKELDARLRVIRDRARSNLRDRGVGTLFAAFGFLEWFEDDAASRPRHAPLILVPVELERRRQGPTIAYRLHSTGETATGNVALQQHLESRFGLFLPEFKDDDSPETYFTKVAALREHQPRWSVRRFLTLQVFSDSKLALYADLDPNDASLAEHPAIRQLLSMVGVADTAFALDHDLDRDDVITTMPALIYDADSSQHSAIVDAMKGGNTTIYGPPGTGKSQTITNLIATAMQDSKTVLFVAEKLTALEVVYDRLNKAGLGEFCFNLHSRGLRMAHIRDSLERRLNMKPSTFDPAEYQATKDRWLGRREALRTYAQIMGKRDGVGRQLNATVHDILWKRIQRRKVANELPKAIAAIRLGAAEHIPKAEVEAARNQLGQLAQAHKSLQQAAGNSERFPWRGIERSDLVDVDRALYQLDQWRQSVIRLSDALQALGLNTDKPTIALAGQACAILATIHGQESLIERVDLTALADPATRTRVHLAHDAALRCHERIAALQCLLETPLPSPSDAANYRALTDRADALRCADKTVPELRALAQQQRQQATLIKKLQLLLEQIRGPMDIDETTTEVLRSIVAATDILQQTPRSILLGRTPALVEEHAAPTLRMLSDKIATARQLRDTLAARFDLRILPDAATLRSAGQKIADRPRLAFFDSAFKDASRLHKRLRHTPSEKGAASEAADLAKLVDYLDSVAELANNAGGRAILGDKWHGLDTDFTAPCTVADWAAKIAVQFAGVGAGRKCIRRFLLEGPLDLLDEVGNLIKAFEAGTNATLAEVAQLAEAHDPAVLTEHAAAFESLADQAASTGLRADQPIGRMREIAALVDEQTKDQDTVVDLVRLGVINGHDGDLNDTLSALAALCTDIDDHSFEPALWCTLAEGITSGRVADHADTVASAVRDERQAWETCASMLAINTKDFLDGSERSDATIPAMLRRADECLATGDSLSKWSHYQGLLLAVGNSHAGPVLAGFRSHGGDLADVVKAYEWILYESLALAIFDHHPELRQLTGNQLRHHRAAFREAEQQLLQLERDRIAYALRQRSVLPGISTGPTSNLTESALITQQLGLQRASISVRDLLGRSGNALRQLKPCFMMSPTTVAELLPKCSELFDMVIIDEASQIPPADALGAIVRGKQAVIVGDPQQLPPTRFFSAGATGNNDGDDAGAAQNVTESILDLSMQAWRPPRYLRWHYRSRDSSLIQFSNAKFYGNQLIVFPGPAESGERNSGVKYHYIDGSVYHGHINDQEAQCVVEAVLEFVGDSENWDRSLAVVAINQPQRDLLDELFEHAAAEHRAFSRYLRKWDATLYPFVIKNLESVQGDERDVIFVSTVYGPATPGGTVAQTFGPLTQSGGERRLNVLFTRARWRIDIFTSMHANDLHIAPRTSKGVRILRDYLQYSESGQIHGGTPTGAATESPFEQHVMERLIAAGYQVTPQVGVAGYRIDLGIGHPGYRAGFILGVECDGATYHSARSVRDRDYLREAVLRDLGWDIYRIWSTDWFANPDQELQKLIEYIEQRYQSLTRTRSHGGAPLAGAGITTALPGIKETRIDHEPDPTPTDEASEIVEIGDDVVYRLIDDSDDVKRVKIVSGPSDENQGIIDDNHPLASALLGASAGQTVTIRFSGSSIDVVVLRIDKNETNDTDQLPVRGKLVPYRAWSGKAPDPLKAPLQDIVATLNDIIATEGPVHVLRACRAYARAGGFAMKKNAKRYLFEAIASLEKEGKIIVDRQSGSTDYEHAVLRIAGSPAVILREAGEREFTEIPLAELAELLKWLRSELLDADKETIRRELLAYYDRKRLTETVRKMLDAADSSTGFSLR